MLVVLAAVILGRGFLKFVHVSQVKDHEVHGASVLNGVIVGDVIQFRAVCKGRAQEGAASDASVSWELGESFVEAGQLGLVFLHFNDRILVVDKLEGRQS